MLSAILLGVTISFLAIYVNRPKQSGYESLELRGRLTSEQLNENQLRAMYGLGSYGGQVVRENIEGELRKGSLEIVVNHLENLTFRYSGTISYMNMYYENELWRAYLNCNFPTENVVAFTFDTRKLISDHGKVTHISISVTEIKGNTSKQQLSEVSIGLQEKLEGEIPFLNQIGTVVPWLTTSIIWISQGLLLGVPLCFASLGVVLIVDRAIIPAWKRQLKGKSLNKTFKKNVNQTIKNKSHAQTPNLSQKNADNLKIAKG